MYTSSLRAFRPRYFGVRPLSIAFFMGNNVLELRTGLSSSHIHVLRQVMEKKKLIPNYFLFMEYLEERNRQIMENQPQSC